MQQLGIQNVAVDMFTQIGNLSNALNAANTLGLNLTAIISPAPVADLPPDEIVAAVVEALTSYLALAPGYTCCMKSSDGRYAVWVYGTALLSLSNWNQVFVEVAEAEYTPFYIFEIPGNSLQIPEGLTVEQYLTLRGGVPPADQYFSFFPMLEEDIPDYASYVSPAPLCGTLMSQYTRSITPPFNVLPPDGGTDYTNQWALVSSPEIQASTVVGITANDIAYPDGDGTNWLGFNEPDSQYGPLELLTQEGLLEWEDSFDSGGSLTETGLSAVSLGNRIGGTGQHYVVLAQ